MILVINNPIGIFLAMFLSGLALIFCVYGPQMFKERWQEMEYPKGTIATKDVCHYITGLGGRAWHVSPSKNTRNWVAFAVIDEKCYIVTVYTDGASIKGHQSFLA